MTDRLPTSPRSTTRRVVLAGLAHAGAAAWLLAPSPARAQADEPTKAQPPLSTVPLRILGAAGVSHAFRVEVARTPREQQVGLMFRRSVPPDGGMLFTWAMPQVSQMWMENTLVPLDMVFIGSDGRIDSIAENTVPQSLAIVASAGPVVATLELAGGTTARDGIVVGDRIVSTALPQRAG